MIPGGDGDVHAQPTQSGQRLGEDMVARDEQDLVEPAREVLRRENIDDLTICAVLTRPHDDPGVPPLSHDMEGSDVTCADDDVFSGADLDESLDDRPAPRRFLRGPHGPSHNILDVDKDDTSPKLTHHNQPLPCELNFQNS